MKRSIIGAILFIAFSQIIVCPSVFANHTAEIKQNIINQAKDMGIEPALALSLAKAESGFRQEVKAPCGTVGVFQLHPTTAKRMGLNPYDLNDNIKGGLTYYQNMYNIFGTKELAIAAYNAGPDAIKRANNKVPSYSQKFVNRIMTDYEHYKKTGI